MKVCNVEHPEGQLSLHAVLQWNYTAHSSHHSPELVETFAYLIKCEWWTHTIL